MALAQSKDGLGPPGRLSRAVAELTTRLERSPLQDPAPVKDRVSRAFNTSPPSGYPLARQRPRLPGAIDGRRQGAPWAILTRDPRRGAPWETPLQSKDLTRHSSVVSSQLRPLQFSSRVTVAAW